MSKLNTGMKYSTIAILITGLLFGCRKDYDCICIDNDGVQLKKFAYYNSKKTIAEVSCKQWNSSVLDCEIVEK